MPINWEDFIKQPSSPAPVRHPLWQQHLAQATQDAIQWAEGHAIASTYARDSAFASAVALPEDVPYPIIRLTTNLILWIYALDRVLDQPELRLVSSTVIDDALSLIHAGFHGRNPPAMIATHLQQQCQALSHALSDIAADMALLWAQYLPEKSNADRSTGFAAEVARLLDAMHKEVTLRASSAPLPTLDAYLAWAQYSIGVPLVSFVVASFSSRGLADVAADQSALLHAACCVRLCNDISGHRLDAADGKVTSVLLTQHASPAATLPLTAVFAHLRQRAVAEADQFVALTTPQPTTWLQSFLLTTIAYALTRYESGGYVRVD